MTITFRERLVIQARNRLGACGHITHISPYWEQARHLFFRWMHANKGVTPCT